MHTAEIAIPVPLRQVYHYAVPAALDATAQLGVRVKVRFAGRAIIGYLIARDTPPPPGVKLQPILAVVDAEPTFDAPILRLARFLADYYHAPLGEVLRGAHPAGTNAKGVPGLALTPQGRAALPHVTDPTNRALLSALVAADAALPVSALALPEDAALKRMLTAEWIIREPVTLAAPVQVKTERVVRVLVPPPSSPRGPGGRPLKRDLVHAWLVGRGAVPTRTVSAEFKGAAGHLRALADEDAVAFEQVEVLRDPFFGEVVARDSPPVLNAAQKKAVAAVLAADGFTGFLLQGITGSGKTEVYLHAIEAVLEAGGGALVLVPEIALTPQLVRRFRARLGDAIAVLHSGLARGARYDQWRRLRRGEVKIAIGARSALFAPVADLQLIVVDEEHDPSFKQHDGVRYHARDMALVRGAQEGARVLLGSATPSLESCVNVDRGKLRRLVLPARATGGSLPTIELVDLREQRPPDPEMPFLSEPLRDALTETLLRKEQAIIFLNRRGFSTYVLCSECGHVMQCPECAISMTWHRSRQRLVCHYSDHVQRMPTRCPECKRERTIQLLGQGTERVHEALGTLFPEARIARMDRDTASGRKLQGLVNQMRRREIDILVGTQMVTKGHDFPHVTLVGVLAADASLQFPDFRADERTYQLLTQVAGRAGRGDRPGRVFVQTYNPEHPVIQAVQAHDFAGFVQASLADRQLQGYPPFTRCASIRIDGENVGQVHRIAGQIGDRLRQTMAHMQASDSRLRVTLRGPAPMPIAMLRNRFRFAMLLTSADRRALHHLIDQVPAIKPPRGVRVVVDIDAYDFL